MLMMQNIGLSFLNDYKLLGDNPLVTNFLTWKQLTQFIQQEILQSTGKLKMLKMLGIKWSSKINETAEFHF